MAALSRADLSAHLHAPAAARTCGGTHLRRHASQVRSAGNRGGVLQAAVAADAVGGRDGRTGSGRVVGAEGRARRKISCVRRSLSSSSADNNRARSPTSAALPFCSLLSEGSGSSVLEWLARLGWRDRRILLEDAPATPAHVWSLRRRPAAAAAAVAVRSVARAQKARCFSAPS